MNRVISVIRSIVKRWTLLGSVAGILLAFYLGAKLTEAPAVAEPAPAPAAAAEHAEHEHGGHEQAKSGSQKDGFWTCVMHPQIHLSEPGSCPICSMTLVPVSTGPDTGGPRTLVMSPADKKLAEIQTTVVERKFVDARIRMVGKIDYDETRVRTISSYVPGRIDKLYINFTGIEVRKEDHLAMIYSPELITAQEELLEANRRVKASAKENSEFLRGSDRRALDSAREKLRLFGFSDKQIADVERRGEPEDHMMINAPLSGVVLHKSVNEGDYVQTGTPIYTVADLKSIWVQLDAYEMDLPWIRFGQPVDLQVEAYPGEHFEGVIAFIDPVLDPSTRTIKVRVNVENKDGRLKPGMFVRATVHSRVAKAGKIMDPSLAGKWISPMHPEIVRDAPGNCPICGMKLLRAEDLGYINSDDEASKPLVVPATAVLKTGHRAVVYVEVPGVEFPTYEGREIVLGTRAGDYYLVKQGLSKGERVVTNGSFSIDSSLQIKAKPSMLTMEGESPEEGGDIATFREELAPVFESYFTAQKQFAVSDLAQAKKAFENLPQAVDSVDMTLLAGDTHDAWMHANRQLKRAAADLAKAPDLDEARKAFGLASTAVIALENRFGHTGDKTYVEVFCPMAFGTGAPWLQFGMDVQNPYYGIDMPTCGEIRKHHAPHTTKSIGAAPAHHH